VSAIEPFAWDSLPAGHVNAPTFPKPEVPSAAKDIAGGPFEHRAVRCRRWPAGQSPHVFIDVRRTST